MNYTLYDAVVSLINFIIPITNEGFNWWANFREIFIIVITLLIFYLAFILPFIRLLKWGIFGTAYKKHKRL